MNLDWTSARARFSERFDAVVMLTASDWSAEPRSNRYHYATRFARVSKVIFVQPDRMSNGFSFSHSGVGDLEILHVPERFDQAQANAIREALEKRNIRHPLIWTYSPHYADVIQELGGVLSVFHATEDFFQPELRGQLPATFYSRLTRLLNRLDLLVVVSEGVRDSYVQQGRYRGEVLLLENGCDFEFWLAHRETLANRASSQRKTAFYQGGINYRLDVDLIAGVARKLPDWEFRFCGARDPSFADWKTVRRLPNVVDLGFLSPEEVAKEAWRADVGIIPFIRKPFIVEKSLPLKAFEYVACDLPVVSVPIRALERWPELFAFAETPEQFSREMLRVAETKPDPELKMKRRLAAQSQDYDSKFVALQERLLAKPDSQTSGRRLSILVLYSPHALFTSTVMEHINSFGMYSRNEVYYATAVDGVDCLYDIARFDVIVIHYSVRLSLEQHISPQVAAAVSGARAHRVLFIQDEYEYTERARRWMEALNIDTVFTCIPDGQSQKIYPSRRFKRVRILTNLTGYVPERLEKMGSFKPLSERSIHIGYRGRPLPFRFGDLAKDKYMIGYRMRQECQSRGIPHDIEVEEDKRIYGDAWYDFLSSCRAVLGSESGSNVFDDDGSIGRQIQSALVENPWLTYEEIRERYLASHESKIRMNQISPRVFEAAATKTALVLFEGEYSGLLQPDVHYMPLKKDFSNLESVIERLLDVDQLEKMVDRTYRDLISSGRWSYRAFIALFDEHLDAVLPVASRTRTEMSSTLDYDDCYFGGVTSWPMPSDGLRDAPQRIRSRFLKDPSAAKPTWGVLGTTLLPAAKRFLWRLGAKTLSRGGSLARRGYRRLPGWARPTADKALRRLRSFANRLPRPQN